MAPKGNEVPSLPVMHYCLSCLWKLLTTELLQREHHHEARRQRRVPSGGP